MGNKKDTKQINQERFIEKFTKFDYQPDIKIARDKYCDELIELLSDESFINPSFERRKIKLKQELELLYTIVWNKFFEKYRED